MRKVHIKNSVPGRYAPSLDKYLDIDLCEAEFIEMVFQHFFMEDQRTIFETTTELTFEIALKEVDYYFYKGDLLIKE